MTRAVSTVVDVSLCLLLTSAAVLVLVTAPAPADPAPDRADETADVLATTTTTVHYALRPPGRDDGRLAGHPRSAFERTTRDTVANLLAAAAVRNAGLDGTALSTAGDGLVASVTNATAGTLRNVTSSVQVRAVWTPYRGAPLTGTVVAGDDPPPGATVHAATVRVPSGLPPTRERATNLTVGGGYDAVARAVASATVRGLFPPERTGIALASDGPTGGLVRYRYRRAGRVLGVDLAGPLAAGDANAANERFVDALAARFAADMRTRFESPAAAAEAVAVGEVRVVVRTWSP